MGWLRDWFPDEAPAAWGARAIFTHGAVDILHDRQDVHGEQPAVTALIARLNAGLLVECRQAAEQLQADWELQANSHDVWVLHQDDEVVVVVSTSASHGYLYIVAFTPPSSQENAA